MVHEQSHGLGSSAVDPSIRFNVQDPGDLYELVHEACAAASAPAEQPASDTAQHDGLFSTAKQDPEVQKALLQYVQSKQSQPYGLLGLTEHSRKAAYQAPLLQALASAAAELVARVTAGAEQLLVKKQLLPQPRCHDAMSHRAAARNKLPTSSGRSSKSRSGQVIVHAAPPSWLHPLLHHMRPDQVVVLVAQLLLYLAGLLEAK